MYDFKPKTKTHVQMTSPTVNGKYHWAKEKPHPLEITTGKSEWVSYSTFVGANHKFDLRPLQTHQTDKNGKLKYWADGQTKILNAKVNVRL